MQDRQFEGGVKVKGLYVLLNKEADRIFLCSPPRLILSAIMLHAIRVRVRTLPLSRYGRTHSCIQLSTPCW